MNDANSPLALCVRRAIDGIAREYPYRPHIVLERPDGFVPPRERTPAFCGCFDWHSAVHSHWLLVRMLRLQPDAEWADDARQTLRRSLSRENLEAEWRHFMNNAAGGFEWPYGQAWLLQLDAELREWDDPLGEEIARYLFSLAILCHDYLVKGLSNLIRPIRTGEHNQTAFAMGLAFDWMQARWRISLDGIIERALAFFGNDRDLPIAFEPSGHDFLSPALAEADLMRQVLSRGDFSTWFERAMPEGFLDHLQPVVPPDRSHGKLAHLDGLNFSRSWMLRAIAEALGPDDRRAPAMIELADRHRAAGEASLASEHYAGTHWLGTFYVYDATRQMVYGR